MNAIDPEQAAERIRKLIVVGDNRLKQGGPDKFAKAAGTYRQALRLTRESGAGERLEALIQRRLDDLERLSSEP